MVSRFHSRRPFFLLPAFAAASIFQVYPVLADPGYMVTVSERFHLRYDIDRVEIRHAELHICSDSQCTRHRIHEADSWSGAMEIACTSRTCTAAVELTAYSGHDQRLLIEFSDRTRVSNVFEVSPFLMPADFWVHVREDDLLVESAVLIDPITQFCGFVPVLLITIVTELAVAAFLFRRMHLPHVPGRIVAANIVTVSFAWILIPKLLLSAALTLVLAEAFAVAFEALFIRFTKSGLDARSSLILALSMNGFSFLIGLVIFGVISIL